MVLVSLRNDIIFIAGFFSRQRIFIEIFNFGRMRLSHNGSIATNWRFYLFCFGNNVELLVIF